MRIVNADIETVIDCTDAKATLLVIENPCFYYHVVNEMLKAFSGTVSDFTFWEGDKQLRADLCGEILYDIFTFSFSSKRMIAALHKRLVKNCHEGEHIVRFQEIGAAVQRFLYTLCNTVDFATEFDELDLENLIKSCSVRPVEKYESLLEKIVCYLNMISSFRSLLAVVFVGLKDVLNDNQLKELYHHCRLQKIYPILIESYKKRPLLPEWEKAIIITEDLCEILENSEDL